MCGQVFSGHHYEVRDGRTNLLAKLATSISESDSNYDPEAALALHHLDVGLGRTALRRWRSITGKGALPMSQDQDTGSSAVSTAFAWLVGISDIF